MKKKASSTLRTPRVIPTILDMNTSLEDARFFYEELDRLIRGPEEHQDIVKIRRYFRAYLHCWKTILHFVREIKGLAKKESEWITRCKKWEKKVLLPNEGEAYNTLRETRDFDTHSGMITVKRIVAVIWPLVMFQPHGKPERELISCCKLGLNVGEKLIREHSSL